MSRLGVPRTGEPISWTHSGARRAFDEFLFRTYLTNPLNYFGPSFVVQGVTRDNLALPSRGERDPPLAGHWQCRMRGKRDRVRQNARQCPNVTLHTTATLCMPGYPPRHVCAAVRRFLLTFSTY